MADPRMTLQEAYGLVVALYRDGCPDREHGARGCARALDLLGLAHYREGDTDSASTLLREAIALAPGNAAYRTHLGLTLEASGESRSAQACYFQATVLDPGDPAPYLHNAVVLRRASRLDEASRGFCRVLTLVPHHPGAIDNLGLALCEGGAPDKAEHSHRLALGLALAAGGPCPDILTNLGEALFRQERHIEAEAIWRQGAVLPAPGAIRARLRLAALLRADGRTDEATTWVGEAAKEALAQLDRLHAVAGQPLDMERLEADFAASAGASAGAGLAGACLDFAARPPEMWRVPGPLCHISIALMEAGRCFFEAKLDARAHEVYRGFVAHTTDRAHYPGHRPQVVTVRPAAAVCREHGWSYRTVTPARSFPLAAGDGALYNYPLPETFLGFASDAVIIPSNTSVLVGGDALLLDGFSTNSRGNLGMVPYFIWQSSDDRVLLDLPEPSHTVEDEAILLGGGVNWSHNVLDWASKLAVLERFPELDHLPVLVSPRLPRSIVGFYAMLGLDPARLRRLPTEHEPVRARRLWLPSLTHRYQLTSPMHVDFLRRRLAGPLGEGLGRPRRRLFLSRRNAGYRALLNEAEVLATLATFGVEPLVPEDFSMAEQIALFASAELVVSPIGGASAAILFAAPGAACVELTHDQCLLPQYGILSGLLGQRYARVVGRPHGNRGPLNFDWDFTISVDALSATIRALLDGTPPGEAP